MGSEDESSIYIYEHREQAFSMHPYASFSILLPPVILLIPETGYSILDTSFQYFLAHMSHYQILISRRLTLVKYINMIRAAHISLHT